MTKTKIINPFSTAFLDKFILAPNVLPLQDKLLIELDQQLSHFEQVFLNPEIEQNLISRNELLASYAISKAENSQLTLGEAEDVYQLILGNEKYSFIADKLKNKEKLTQKDHDKLEFFNIAQTFHSISKEKFFLKELTPKYIQNLHKQLTQGLDVFGDHVQGYEPYKSGHWRDNDSVRVGSYTPASYELIPKGVVELIKYIQDDPTPIKVAIFHTALYALHPFNNGNKRICRILEHLLLRSIGLNAKNLYSTSYYYHQHKDRYYKHLLFSLERNNLNHFVSFVQEALSLSIVSVVQLSLQSKRREFLSVQSSSIQTILKPLIKRRELQFKNLFKRSKKKMARQTFVNYLDEAVTKGVVTREKRGKNVYYSLKLLTNEQDTTKNWIKLLQPKLPHIPDKILLV